MIFSKTTCPFCDDVKELFRSLGVEYTVLELDKEQNGPQIQQGLQER